ncbi:hypothetical protein N7524_008700, partial [Penicillium chrysogenum]
VHTSSSSAEGLLFLNHSRHLTITQQYPALRDDGSNLAKRTHVSYGIYRASLPCTVLTFWVMRLCSVDEPQTEMMRSLFRGL